MQYNNNVGAWSSISKLNFQNSLINIVFK